MDEILLLQHVFNPGLYILYWPAIVVPLGTALTLVLLTYAYGKKKHYWLPIASIAISLVAYVVLGFFFDPINPFG